MSPSPSIIPRWRLQNRILENIMVILRIIHCIFASILAVDEIQIATALFLVSHNTAELRTSLREQTGSGKSKGAVIEPKVCLCQLMDVIAAKFRRLYFGGPAIQRCYGHHCASQPEVENNPRWRPLNRKYLYLSL